MAGGSCTRWTAHRDSSPSSPSDVSSRSVQLVRRASATVRAFPDLDMSDAPQFDLIVIGGGVNGTGIARDAAMRGLKTLMLEKRDVASGASGGNSGMIHGGVRYLRYDRKVTELACIDSGYIQRIVPHLL